MAASDKIFAASSAAFLSDLCGPSFFAASFG